MEPLSWITALAALSSLPGSLELLVLTIGASLPARRRQGDARPTVGHDAPIAGLPPSPRDAEAKPSLRREGEAPPSSVSPPGSPRGSPSRFPGRGPAAARLAIVIPAHDEEGLIGRCIASLRECRGLGDDDAVVVVADNCKDATAARAAAAGARVLVRDDDARRGKGFALQHAFAALEAERFDAMVVLDADSRVHPLFLESIRQSIAAGADAVQARYLLRVATGDLGPSAEVRLQRLAFFAINCLRPRGRERLGLSAGINGNGFALTRHTLESVPFTVASLVEDVEYHLRLVDNGFRVRFAEDAVVWADPPSPAARSGQLARWQGGRLRLLRSAGPGLAVGIANGRWRLAEPLLDLCLVPLGLHAVLVALACASPSTVLRSYALAAVLILAAHVATALALAGGDTKDVLSLAWTPVTLLRRLRDLPSILRASRRDFPWVRTKRDG